MELRRYTETIYITPLEAIPTLLLLPYLTRVSCLVLFATPQFLLVTQMNYGKVKHDVSGEVKKSHLSASMIATMLDISDIDDT